MSSGRRLGNAPRLLAAALAVAACGGGGGGTAPDAAPADATPCDVEAEVAGLAGDGSIDCGNIAFDQGNYAAAHDCVAKAYADGASFHVLWESPGIDSIIRGGYVGVAGGGAVEVQRLWYDSDPSGGSHIGAVLSAAACADFAAEDPCDGDYAYYESLCFICPTPGAGTWLCHP